MIRNGYVTKWEDWVFSNELTKKIRSFFHQKKDEASSWLTSGHEKNFTSVGGRKNFPLVVLDDTLGDNLITWPLNLLWVKGDFELFGKSMKDLSPIGGPYSKTSAEKQLTFKV